MPTLLENGYLTAHINLPSLVLCS